MIVLFLGKSYHHFRYSRNRPTIECTQRGIELINQGNLDKIYRIKKSKEKTVNSFSKNVSSLNIVENRINYFEKIIEELNFLREELHSSSIPLASSELNLREREAKPNPFFYEISNHQELFHLGLQFQEDILQQKKLFAILATNNKKLQEISILGLASYLNYQHQHRVLILSHKIQNTAFKRLEDEGTDLVHTQNGQDVVATADCDGVAIYDLDDLALYKAEKAQAIINILVKKYDVVLFDLKSVQFIPANASYYFYLFTLIDNLSIVIHKNQTKFSQLNKILNSIKNYNLALKGVIWSDFSFVNKNEGTNEKE